MPRDRHRRRRRTDRDRTPLALGRGTPGRLAAGVSVGGVRADGSGDSARFAGRRGTQDSRSTPKGAAGPADDPPVRKRYVELPPPTRGDDAADLLRLERALAAGPLEIDLSLLREIPARLRAADFRGTAVAGRTDRLLDFEPGNTEADAFAVAFDIGTTTLVATLLDLGTGSEWAVDARLNPQTRFGDDVLSRILHARQDARRTAAIARSDPPAPSTR